jgi:hypothetical protein
MSLAALPFPERRDETDLDRRPLCPRRAGMKRKADDEDGEQQDRDGASPHDRSSLS